MTKAPPARRPILSGLAILTFGTLAANASIITWTSGAFDADADVSTTGTLIEARYFNGPNGFLGGTSQLSGPISVNGVGFTDADFTGVYPLTNLTGLTYDTGGFGHTSAPSGFGAIIAGFAFKGGTDPQNATLSGLTPGNDYLVEFYYYHASSNRTLTIDDGLGNDVTLVDTNDTGTGPGVFATGTFTADGATQQLIFDADTGSQFLNGYQLRQTATAVPEASEALVVLLGMTGLMGARRRRR